MVDICSVQWPSTSEYRAGLQGSSFWDQPFFPFTVCCKLLYWNNQDTYHIHSPLSFQRCPGRVKLKTSAPDGCFLFFHLVVSSRSLYSENCCDGPSTYNLFFGVLVFRKGKRKERENFQLRPELIFYNTTSLMVVWPITTFLRDKKSISHLL